MRGIKIIGSNDNLCKEYLKSSEEDFINLEKVSGKWTAVTAYYACYNALYALLCKVGIKCEIHECTIDLMGILGYNKTDIRFIEGLKDNRIQSQYYLKRPEKINIFEIRKFITKTKGIILNFDENKVKETLSKLKNG